MQQYTFTSVAKMLDVVPFQQPGDPIIESLLTDSRRLLFPGTTLFFSISSDKKNASQFILPLYEKGVRSFVVSNGIEKDNLKKCEEGNFILVDDVMQALQTLVIQHRKRFSFPVIGITGSNGKTIVKEWLYQLLHSRYNVVKSPKSFNSQSGVPLSVWQLNNTHSLAIFEAGISTINEMNRLQKLIDPDIGIFTFIGNAHAAGFTDIDEKINEKLQLFVNSKVLVYDAGDLQLDKLVHNFKLHTNNQLELFSWSSKSDSRLTVYDFVLADSYTEIKCLYNKITFQITVPFTDDASIHNAITCVCVLLYLQVPIKEIISGVQLLRSVEMRMELKQGINNCSVINDSYSLDVDSLTIALDFLLQQQQHPTRTLVLSDLLQTGKPPYDLYKNIADILSHKKITRLIGIGPEISRHQSLFTGISETAFFHSTELFLTSFAELVFKDETILLKGARVFGFERIAHELEQFKHETVLEIDLNAVRQNLLFYRGLLKKEVKIMVMVKAFSYGSGSFEIANVMQHAGVNYLAVAYADEGVALRKAGITIPIMVMNIEEAGFENLLMHDLEPELYSFRITHAFINFLSQKSLMHYPVHIKIDTGMHRLGFEITDTKNLCELLQRSGEIQVRSVFSHLAASNSREDDAFTEFQAASFIKMADNIQQATGYDFIRHIANTSAIHRHPKLQMDMVRLGIGLYGVDNDESVHQHLNNVTTLRTTISQIKFLKKGESVGYSRKGQAETDTTIATVRVGYADGYPRSLGNGKGKMLVNGKLAPVIGNICMDMTMLDITGIKAAEGDAVTVFGKDLPVSIVSIWADTIAYEMLTGISRRVKRIYYQE